MCLQQFWYFRQALIFSISIDEREQIPTVAKLCANAKSPLTGDPVQVVAAGGLYNGQSLAAALMLGASAVWIGTRFVLSEEAGAPKAHQEAVRSAGFDDNGIYCTL